MARTSTGTNMWSKTKNANGKSPSKVRTTVGGDVDGTTRDVIAWFIARHQGRRRRGNRTIRGIFNDGNGVYGGLNGRIFLLQTIISDHGSNIIDLELSISSGSDNSRGYEHAEMPGAGWPGGILQAPGTGAGPGRRHPA